MKGRGLIADSGDNALDCACCKPAKSLVRVQGGMRMSDCGCPRIRAVVAPRHGRFGGPARVVARLVC
jgi:hypothetical protein